MGAPVIIADKKPREGHPVLAKSASWRHVLLILLASAACATVQPNSESLSPTRADSAPDRRLGADRNVITRSEILPAMLSAYDVVQYRRPRWLLGRGTVPSDEGKPETPLVYLEGVRYGTLEALKSINALEVAELRFLDARDATTRLGSGHTTGVILVTLRRR
jgi:hypothetical protein